MKATEKMEYTAPEMKLYKVRTMGVLCVSNTEGEGTVEPGEDF